MRSILSSESIESPRVAFRRWLRAFLPFAVILLFDPLGCSQVADRYSEQIVLRVLAPFHSGPLSDGAVQSTDGQKKVAVVLLDQPWLNAIAPRGTRGTWPPPRSYQIGMALRPILEQGPEAVLLDYSFNADSLQAGVSPGQYDPESTEAIREALEEERTGHRDALPASGKLPRIFLGSKPLFPSVTGGCRVPMIDFDEVKAADDVAPTLRSWPEASGASDVEIVSLRRYDPDDRYSLLPYEVATRTKGCGRIETPADARYLASPALALFTAYCERDGKGGPAAKPGEAVDAGRSLCPDIGRSPAFPPKIMSDKRTPAYYLYSASLRFPGVVAPVWPAFRSTARVTADDWLINHGATNIANRIQACRPLVDGPIKLLLAFRLFWTKLFARANNGDAACRYGVDVYNMASLKALADRPDAVPPLRNRYVIVGLAIPSVPDEISSSLYDDVPGALLHAVVLENLISQGADVLSDRVPNASISVTMAVLLLGTILSLIPTVFATDRGVAAMLRGSRRLFRGGHFEFSGVVGATVVVLAILLGLAIPLMIGLFLTIGWHLAPMNWISLVPAMIWLYEQAMEANETDLRGVEIADTERLASKSGYWIWHLLLPAIVTLIVAFQIAFWRSA